MTDFVVTITDPDELAGITWAREQHNAALPPPPPEDMGVTTLPVVPPDGVVQLPATTVDDPLLTDEAYVQWVMEQAARSYSDQKLRHEYEQEYQAAVNARAG
jgi:hypothetical protein